MIAGAEGLRQQSHVAVDIIPRIMSKKGQNILGVFSNVIIILVCLVLTWQGFNMALDSTLINDYSCLQSTFNPHIWRFKWIIPISSTLILLQAFKQLLCLINKFREKGDEK